MFENSTINHISEISDELATIIPKDFNNNIQWNLGHIYVVQEKFAFMLSVENMSMPKEFPGLFGPGTKPGNWDTKVPTLNELVELLRSQVGRVEYTLKNKLKDSLEKPFITSSGFEVSSVEELLSFCLYHEGMHFDAIKSIKRKNQIKV